MALLLWEGHREIKLEEDSVVEKHSIAFSILWTPILKSNQNASYEIGSPWKLANATKRNANICEMSPNSSRQLVSGLAGAH
jgi:hypothetical protein